MNRFFFFTPVLSVRDRERIFCLAKSPWGAKSESDKSLTQNNDSVMFRVALFMFFFLFFSGYSQSLSDATLANLSFDQKLNSQISLELPFRDESGRQAQLGDCFGHRPALLVLGYYQCPMLCTLVMNGMVEALQEIKWSIGTEFDVINVSIDPTETPALASAKKRTYLKRYGRAGASSGWRFLTGDEQAIRQLAQQVGFKFAYDKPSRQYAHPSGLVILTSEGKVSSYLFGITYSSKDLLAALKGASSNQISSPIQKLILLCFHYNPITGKYGTAIMTTIRVLSIGTMLALVWLLIVSTRVTRHRHECAIHSLPSKETS